jgi:uncharacterized membrane protein YphA (DoxX/SURF4 family)
MVFLSEGIQKFIFATELGAGRFSHIGIPAPEVMGPFVGVVEIVAGVLILLGLLTRPAALVLLVNISVAILSTKIPILLGHGFWVFTLPKLQRYGFWSMAHEVRTDFCMCLGCLFLAIVGAGTLSVDGWLESHLEDAHSLKANLTGEPAMRDIPATTLPKDNPGSESKPK